MFRPTDPQQELFGTAGLLPAKKRAACEKSWAGPFREKELPILVRAEPEFAEFYDDFLRGNHLYEALGAGFAALTFSSVCISAWTA